MTAAALQKLKERGHKLTRTRASLLKAINEFTRPFSTEEAFKATMRHSRAVKIDLVTVYRSLAAFAEIGIVSRVEFGDGVVRYELADPNGGHHHHFVCESCHKVEPLHLCEIDRQEKQLKAAGYTRLSHRLEFFGLCPDCGPDCGPDFGK